MSNFNSQEQMIYRSLAGQIQLGFYQDGERFPTIQEIADRYGVSYCPAQRAVKELEKDGLIQVTRGKETVVLGKPNDNYLKSTVFYQRIPALKDLFHSLQLISSSICFQGLCAVRGKEMPELPGTGKSCTHSVKHLYRLFNLSLDALGNRTIKNLYYDIGAFAESSFQDILYAVHGKSEADAYFNQLSETLLKSIKDCHAHHYVDGLSQLKEIEQAFFEDLERYFRDCPGASSSLTYQPFTWEPYKGRVRYCDIIAMDLLRKINQGVYPVDTLLPSKTVLADMYHVSKITMRRTIELLDKLEVTQTRNGIGTSVICKSDSSIPYRIKSLMTDDSFKTFLEALQFLVITCEPVIQYTFAYCSPSSLDTIAAAIDTEEQLAAPTLITGACLQAVVHHCPLAAIREIYGKITLLLLNGSILHFNDSIPMQLPDWPDIRRQLSQSLDSREGGNFAAAFKRLSEDYFILMKKHLLKLGIAEADKLCCPRS